MELTTKIFCLCAIVFYIQSALLYNHKGCDTSRHFIESVLPRKCFVAIKDVSVNTKTIEACIQTVLNVFKTSLENVSPKWIWFTI